jgi:hypothetical protein
MNQLIKRISLIGFAVCDALFIMMPQEIFEINAVPS